MFTLLYEEIKKLEVNHIYDLNLKALTIQCVVYTKEQTETIRILKQNWTEDYILLCRVKNKTATYIIYFDKELVTSKGLNFATMVGWDVMHPDFFKVPEENS